MPIEIRELVIRAVVDPERASGRPALRPGELEKLKKDILTACLERLAEERAAKARR
jgi:hypothetical protein